MPMTEAEMNEKALNAKIFDLPFTASLAMMAAIFWFLIDGRLTEMAEKEDRQSLLDSARIEACVENGGQALFTGSGKDQAPIRNQDGAVACLPEGAEELVTQPSRSQR